MSEYVEAIGRRKTATARVRLYAGTGEIVVNELPVNVYFGRALDQMILRQPLSLTGTEGTYNISVHVNGGGDNGQAAAVRVVHALDCAKGAIGKGARVVGNAVVARTIDAVDSPGR